MVEWCGGGVVLWWSCVVVDLCGGGVVEWWWSGGVARGSATLYVVHLGKRFILLNINKVN